MVKYEITKLANRPKGSIVKLPPIDVRIGTLIEYERLLNRYLREIAAETRRSVLVAFEADKRFKKAKDSLIVDSESWFTSLKSKELEIRSAVVNQATNIFRLEAQKNTQSFMTNARKALGIDLTSVVHEEDLDSVLQDYADSNASLIKSLGEDTIKKVEQSVYAAKLSGTSSKELSKTFQKEFGISQNRANLIASDQLNKLNSDFNRTRQEQAGIQKYEWLTSKDERVRNRHRNLQGKIYKLKETTGAEQGLPPGKPIRCRCLAIPIIEFGATAVEEIPVRPTLPEPILQGPATRLATRPTAAPDFEDGREVLKVSGKAYMPDKVSNADPNLIQVTIRSDFLEENWIKNTADYIGKDDKGIISAGKGPDGQILRDKDGNPVKLSRKDWFKRWMQENPSIPIETPIISVDKTGLVDFTNGRHRTSVLIHDEKVSNMVVTIHKDDLENAKEYLGAVHIKGKLKPRNAPSPKPVAASSRLDTKKGFEELNKLTPADKSKFSDFLMGEEENEKNLVVTPIKFIDPNDSDVEKSILFMEQKDDVLAKTANSLVDVDIDELVTYQPFVDKIKVKNYIESGSLEGTSNSSKDKPPIGVRINGKIILQDGNHRVSAWKLSGEKNMPVLVYDLDVPTPAVAPKKTFALNTPEEKEKAWKELNDKLDEITKVSSQPIKTFSEEVEKAKARKKEIYDMYFNPRTNALHFRTPDEIRNEYKEILKTIRTQDKAAGASIDKKVEFHKALFDATPTVDKIDYVTDRKSVNYLVESTPPNNKEQKSIDNGVEFFRNLINKDNYKGDTIKFARIKDRKRAFYSNEENLINYNSAGRSISTKTIIHELTHKIEYSYNEAKIQTVKFLDKRQGKEKLKSLISGAKPGQEDGFDDEWAKRGGNKYTSRRYSYSSLGVSKRYEIGDRVRATEVLTMGVERLYDDPIKFRKQDPEHFEITVKSLLKLW